MDELKKLGIYDKTVIFITGDHGQTVAGGHPPFAQDAWPMPLIVAGAGVKADQQFAYSERIDVVPTLCYLMGAPLPDDMTDPSLRPPLADFERDFHDIEKMLRWRQFGTVRGLIHHNREV